MQSDELLCKAMGLRDAKQRYLCTGRGEEYQHAVRMTSWVLRQHVEACVSDIDAGRAVLTPDKYSELQTLIRVGKELVLNAIVTQEDLDLRMAVLSSLHERQQRAPTCAGS